MKYLLDTNSCIRYLNKRSETIINHMRQHQPTDIVVCSVVKAELFTGAMKSEYPERTLKKQIHFLSKFISLPFDDKSATEYSKIRASLEKAGTPIGPNDLLIASIAIANALILVSNNTREFQRITELHLENWESQ